MTEEWRQAIESRLHEVSNLGRVRRKCKNGRFRYLSGNTCKQGYVTVGLAGGSGGAHRVHRLVATAFLEPDPDRHFVNHIDGNPSNNHVANLEWVTIRENTHHAMALGLRDACHHYGETNGSAKLTTKDVVGIRSLYAKGFLQKELACLYDVSQRSISLVVRREKWSHVI